MAKKQLKYLRNVTLKTGGRHHLPLPTGIYKKVGCRDFMVGLSRKSGVLARLFYPAKFDQSKATDNGEMVNPLLWPNWLPHDSYRQGFADVINVKSRIVMSLIESTTKKNVFIPAIPNAKLHSLPDGQKYPVVIFSHGLGGCRTSYSSICVELASRGFVVAAIEHRDNSACLSFYPKRSTYSFKSSNPNFFATEAVDEVDADDEVDFGDELDDASYVPPKALQAMSNLPHLEMAWIRHRYVPLNKFGKQIYDFRNKQIHHRARECTRCLDLIEALNAGYEINNLFPGYNAREFENVLDMERLTVMGHSMGGATAMMAAAAELRFKVAIALDPWMYPIKDEPLDLISQPTLVICTEELSKGKNKAKIEELFKSTSNDEDYRQAFIIKKSRHFQQSDVPYVFSKFAQMFTSFSSRSSLDPFLVHDLTCCHSLQFISKHLNLPLDESASQYIEEKKKLIKPLLS